MSADRPDTWRFEAIGTQWEIDVYEHVEPTAWIEIQQGVTDIIAEFDGRWSRFRSDSLVTLMANQAGLYPVSAEVQELLRWYHSLYRATDGAVTPLIGQVLADAGYDAVYSFVESPISRVPSWSEVIRLNGTHIELRSPALLDIGAAGKGRLIDLVCKYLESLGIEAYCVDASGDLRYRYLAGPPLRVGLEHPNDPGKVIGVATLPSSGSSLCGSAGNRRTWGRFHHIIDPRTLKSVEAVRAVWVTTPQAMQADGLATALFFTAAQDLAKEFSFEYALIRESGELEWSAGFEAEFF